MYIESWVFWLIVGLLVVLLIDDYRSFKNAKMLAKEVDDLRESLKKTIYAVSEEIDKKQDK